MNVTYYCPHCRGAINVLDYIVLSARCPRHKAGLILLHEEIGNYTVRMSESISAEIGDIFDLFCPICHETLNTEKGEHFASFIRTDKTGMESKIIVSRKYGDQYTLKITGTTVESYGESARKFIDPEWFL
jgi:hypothetical protein